MRNESTILKHRHLIKCVVLFIFVSTADKQYTCKGMFFFAQKMQVDSFVHQRNMYIYSQMNHEQTKYDETIESLDTHENNRLLFGD